MRPKQPPAVARLPWQDVAELDETRERARALGCPLHAQVAPWSGLSPISLALATTDWALHLATQPAQASRLATKAFQVLAGSTWAAAIERHPPGGASERPDDQRFIADPWRRWPYSWIVRNYLDAERWWRDTTQLRGMTAHHRGVVGFFARKWLDMLSPANAGLANAEVLQRTLDRRGLNLVDGIAHALFEWRRRHGLEQSLDTARSSSLAATSPLRPGRWFTATT